MLWLVEEEEEEEGRERMDVAFENFLKELGFVEIVKRDLCWWFWWVYWVNPLNWKMYHKAISLIV